LLTKQNLMVGVSVLQVFTSWNSLRLIKPYRP